MDQNIQRAAKSLQSFKKNETYDIVMFSEMAFTGYNFMDEDDVRPFAERQGEGKIFQFLSEWAVKLKSYVIAGYPEIAVDEASKKETLYNSCYLIGRDGKLVLNYRKHFLFESDYLWAKRGESFQAVELTNLEGQKFKAALGNSNLIFLILGTSIHLPAHKSHLHGH